jgi:hypothetical protein
MIAAVVSITRLNINSGELRTAVFPAPPKLRPMVALMSG